MNIIAILLAAIIIVLQVADYWTTRKVLDKGGVELNGFVRWLMDKLGRNTGLAVVKLFASAVIAVCTAIDLFVSPFGILVLFVLAVFYAVVVYDNVGVLDSMR